MVVTRKPFGGTTELRVISFGELLWLLSFNYWPIDHWMSTFPIFSYFVRFLKLASASSFHDLLIFCMYFNHQALRSKSRHLASVDMLAIVRF